VLEDTRGGNGAMMIRRQTEFSNSRKLLSLRPVHTIFPHRLYLLCTIEL
jgi:hypothetical protein